jgi:hypothetical protein
LLNQGFAARKRSAAGIHHEYGTSQKMNFSRLLTFVPGSSPRLVSVYRLSALTYLTGIAGLILAEGKFDSAATAEALPFPSFAVGEVSTDDRFTGGELVRASREDIQIWMLSYGVAQSNVVRSL